ncbi:hypothetical protein ACTXT7_013198 [Hymenolepis weldensis]
MQVNVSRRRYETFCINGRHIELQVDTGSDITMVSDEAWKTLGSLKLDTVPFCNNVSGLSGPQRSNRWNKSSHSCRQFINK